MAAGELASPLPAPALRALEAEYEFLREVGRGGMATVYLARARASGRVVAIKTVATHRAHDPEAVARFAREARTVLALDHPNIVRSYSVETLENGALAIVMQHAAGGTLREALRETQRSGEPIPVERVASILADVAAALAHAHDRGVVHRDVKPENVFLDPRNGRALLSDFGIARTLDGDQALTMTGSAIGTPTYMSPEQIDGLHVDGRSDVYALGLVGWELLAGARPWEGDSLYSVIYKQKHEALAPLALLRPDVPEALRAAIERALRKDPAQRWPDAGAFEEALRDALPLATPVATLVETRADGDDIADSADEAAAATAARFGPGQNEAIEQTYDDPREQAPDESQATTRETFDEAAPAYDDAAHATSALAPAVVTDRGPRARRGGQLARRAAVLTRRAAARTRARYRSAPPAARLALPLALAIVAALAVRQGARSRPDATVASVDSALTLPAAGEVVETGSADTLGASPTPANGSASGAVAPPASGAASGRRAGVSGAAAARPPVGLARYARTHGDSLALCRSAAVRDQRACFTAMLADRDARLNATYARLVSELRRRDGSEVARLRAEELRWMQQRDAECAREGRGHEGALWAPSRAACLGAAADRRDTELAARLDRLRAR